VRFAVAGGWAHDPADAAPGNVTWLGFLHRRALARWLAAADVCLVTTSRGADRASQRHFEWTMPLKLSDYLAARRPILSTDLPSLPARGIDDGCARIVPQGDADAFADALCELVTDAEEARRLADGAWARACAYTWSDRARDVLQALAPELWGGWAG
jgi:glycosyltransferase involved in cell wall biosynthesis